MLGLTGARDAGIPSPAYHMYYSASADLFPHLHSDVKSKGSWHLCLFPLLLWGMPNPLE